MFFIIARLKKPDIIDLLSKNKLTFTPSNLKTQYQWMKTRIIVELKY